MANTAQDEFNALRNGHSKSLNSQPEDASLSSSDNESVTLHSPYHDDDPMLASTPTMHSATYHIPSNINFTANTGPKGVIADARSFEMARKRSFRQTLHALSGSQSPPSLGRNKSAGRVMAREKGSSSEDDEDDFMRTWRASRLEELSRMSSELRTRRHSPSQRKYGSLVAVDPAGYLDAVEKVPADTIVVVLIYDDEVGACFLLPPWTTRVMSDRHEWMQSVVSNVVEDALRNLARKHNTTRFVKLHQLDAEMDDIAVPGILAYKGGDCFANLVSIANELPAGREWSSSTLESILQR